MSLFSTAGLARASARRPWVVVVAWIAILVAGGFASGFLNTTTDFEMNNNPESQRASDLIDERSGHEEFLTETVIVRSEQYTIDQPEFLQQVEATRASLDGLEVVTGTFDYYQAIAADNPNADGLVSEDRHTTLIQVQLGTDLEQSLKHADEYLETIHDQRAGGFDVYTVGIISSNEEFNTMAEEDLLSAEMVSLPITLIILLLVFAALTAAGVPLILAVLSIAVATGLSAIVSVFFELSFFVTNMISMIGLAVGIDYSLFVIERYREERRHGANKLDAIEIAGGTASKAVLFSGITVALALVGMFILPSSIYRSLAIGAILAVLVAVTATLTLVPAIIDLLGDRIDVRMWRNLRAIGGWLGSRYRNPGRVKGLVGAILVTLVMIPALVLLLPLALLEVVVLDGILRFYTKRREAEVVTVDDHGRYSDQVLHGGFWGTISKTVMTHPVIALVLALTLLIGAALPFFDMKTGQSGVETLPESDVKTAFLILQEDFYVGQLSPVKIVVDGDVNDPGVQASIDNLFATMATDPQFGTPTTEVGPQGDLTIIEVPLSTDANAQASYDAVERLREEWIPAAFADAPQGTEALVGGDTAFNADFNQLIDDYTPIVFAFVLGLSFLLLLLVFRSIVVPVKAIIMNLLSVGAAYGLLVAVFQKGYGAGLLGFQETPTIDAWIPIFLFCVLFGLSMDYHVFLLSRIREHFDLTGNNRESVAVGLQSTARIITGAALIMVAVFGAFASGRLVALQQMGFGLAVAVLIDATIIRSILVPSAMALLGNFNWYLPKWLNWLPDVRVEGARPPSTVPTPAPTPTFDMEPASSD